MSMSASNVEGVPSTSPRLCSEAVEGGPCQRLRINLTEFKRLSLTLKPRSRREARSLHLSSSTYQ